MRIESECLMFLRYRGFIIKINCFEILLKFLYTLSGQGLGLFLRFEGFLLRFNGHNHSLKGFFVNKYNSWIFLLIRFAVNRFRNNILSLKFMSNKNLILVFINLNIEEEFRGVNNMIFLLN